MRIFCDLDGVLVNMEKGWLDRVNSVDPTFLDKIKYNGDFKNIDKLIIKYFEDTAPNDKEKEKAKFRGPAKFWSFIKGDVSFWTHLEFLPDAHILLDSLYTLRQNNIISELNILSSPSKSDADAVTEGKLKWVDTKLKARFDNTYIDRDKFKYADSSSDILIDDTKKKIDSWITAGGTGILHKNATQTVEQLNKIIINK